MSELDQQLSKLHNQRPVLSQQPTSQPQTFSEIIRQSPTTVQQQIIPQSPAQSIQSVAQNNAQPTPTSQQLQTPATAPTRKLSRFMVSKVSESSEPKTQQQQPPQIIQTQPTQNVINPTPVVQQQQVQVIPKSTLNSPDNDQQMINDQQMQLQRQIQQQQIQLQQQGQIIALQQAQNFFQQHQGGLVS